MRLPTSSIRWLATALHSISTSQLESCPIDTRYGSVHAKPGTSNIRTYVCMCMRIGMAQTWAMTRAAGHDYVGASHDYAGASYPNCAGLPRAITGSSVSTKLVPHHLPRQVRGLSFSNGQHPVLDSSDSLTLHLQSSRHAFTATTAGTVRRETSGTVPWVLIHAASASSSRREYGIGSGVEWPGRERPSVGALSV